MIYLGRLILMFVLVFSISGANMTAASGQARNLAEFTLKAIDGGTINSQTIHGKVVIFAFGATWMPLLKTQIQGLKELADNFAPAGVLVYWVCIDSESAKSKTFASDEQIRGFVAKNNIQVKVLRDPDGVFSKQLGVTQIPAAVIIGKTGVISAGPIEGFDPNKSMSSQLEPKLNDVLKQP